MKVTEKDNRLWLDGIEIDAASGLPLLPKNEFWKVTANAEYINIAHRRTTGSFLNRGTITVGHAEPVLVSYEKVSREKIDDAILDSTLAYMKDAQAAAERKEIRASISGIYPPKRLS